VDVHVHPAWPHQRWVEPFHVAEELEAAEHWPKDDIAEINPFHVAKETQDSGIMIDSSS
jgi:hypothetical protein